MTLFDTGYRAAEYRPVGRFGRLWPIALLELGTPLRSRWSVLTFLALFAPNLASLAILLIVSGVWQLGGPRGEARGRVLEQLAGLDPALPGFYLAPTLHWPFAFLVTLVVTTLVGSRAIARDRASDALEILWTRGISPFDYFVGKWLGSAALLGVYTVAGPAVLWCVAFATTDADDFVAVSFAPVGRALLALAVFTLTITGFAVGLSACFRRPNAAAIAWALLLVGATGVVEVFAELLRDQDWLRALAPWIALVRATDAIAGVASAMPVPAGAAAVSIGIAAVLLGLAVRRRLRVTEAIA